LRTQLREKSAKVEDLMKELKFMQESCDLKILDMQNLIKAKEETVQDALNLVSEKELEIQRLLRQAREAEEAIKEYRGRSQALEEEI